MSEYANETEYSNSEREPSLAAESTSSTVENRETVSILSTSRETSWVWNYYSKKYNNRHEVTSIVCSLCQTCYKPSNTDGTLAKHLQNKHPNKAIKKQSTLDAYTAKPYSRTDKKYQQLTNTLINTIVCCQLPFAIVDNPYFITMLNTLDGCYSVPCRQTIRKEVINRHDSMREEILKELVKPRKLSITCDIWSSVTMQSYLGVTVHFIDNEWNLRHFLLDLCYFPGQHTSQRIEEFIMRVLEDANITNKLLCMTTDNAASMVAAGCAIKERLSAVGNVEFIHH